MNENFRELKARIRKLDAQLVSHGADNLPFAQAVSRVRRAVKRGDRSREPSPELRNLLETAEDLGRQIGD